MISVMPMFRARRATAALGFLLLTLAACTTWQVGTPTPFEFVQRERPTTIRVTRTDGATLLLAHPVIVGDSLVGSNGAVVGTNDTTATIRLGAGEISSVAVRHVSTGRTILLIGGVMLVAGIAAGGMDFGPNLNGMGGP